MRFFSSSDVFHLVAPTLDQRVNGVSCEPCLMIAGDEDAFMSIGQGSYSHNTAERHKVMTGNMQLESLSMCTLWHLMCVPCICFT